MCLRGGGDDPKNFHFTYEGFGIEMGNAKGENFKFLVFWLRILEECLEIDEKNHLLDFLAKIIQFPGMKTDIFILIKSSQGTGKNSFMKHIGKILGKYINNSMEVVKINDKFNEKRLSEKILVILNEMPEVSKRKNKVKNTLKTLITEKRIEYERKFGDSFEGDNTGNYIGFTNSLIPLELDYDDRRTTVMVLKNSLVNNELFWNKYHQVCESPEMITAVFTFLKNRDINSDIMKHLQTSAKFELIYRCFDYTRKFMCDHLEITKCVY
jgi:hypothetical protein